jgi:hypothetical protein
MFGPTATITSTAFASINCWRIACSEPLASEAELAITKPALPLSFSEE